MSDPAWHCRDCPAHGHGPTADLAAARHTKTWGHATYAGVTQPCACGDPSVPGVHHHWDDQPCQHVIQLPP